LAEQVAADTGDPRPDEDRVLLIVKGDPRSVENGDIFGPIVKGNPLRLVDDRVGLFAQLVELRVLVTVVV